MRKNFPGERSILELQNFTVADVLMESKLTTTHRGKS